MDAKLNFFVSASPVEITVGPVRLMAQPTEQGVSINLELREEEREAHPEPKKEESKKAGIDYDLGSWSVMDYLSPDVREQLIEEVAAIIRSHDEEEYNEDNEEE